MIDINLENLHEFTDESFADQVRKEWSRKQNYGFGSPQIHIEYLGPEIGHKDYSGTLVHVLISFQGSVTSEKWSKGNNESKPTVTIEFFTSKDIEWMYQAMQFGERSRKFENTELYKI